MAPMGNFRVRVHYERRQKTTRSTDALVFRPALFTATRTRLPYTRRYIAVDRISYDI